MCEYCTYENRRDDTCPHITGYVMDCHGIWRCNRCGSTDAPALLQAFPTGCHYCGRKATTRDHVVPKSKYGPTQDWNLVPACKACNARKGNHMPSCPCDHCQNAIIRWQTR